MSKRVYKILAILWTILIFYVLVAFRYTENKTLKFELSVDETQLILDALAELPAKKSYNLMTKIINISNEQLKAK